MFIISERPCPNITDPETGETSGGGKILTPFGITGNQCDQVTLTTVGRELNLKESLHYAAFGPSSPRCAEESPLGLYASAPSSYTRKSRCGITTGCASGYERMWTRKWTYHLDGTYRDFEIVTECEDGNCVPDDTPSIDTCFGEVTPSDIIQSNKTDENWDYGTSVTQHDSFFHRGSRADYAEVKFGIKIERVLLGGSYTIGYSIYRKVAPTSAVSQHGPYTLVGHYRETRIATPTNTAVDSSGRHVLYFHGIENSAFISGTDEYRFNNAPEGFLTLPTVAGYHYEIKNVGGIANWGGQCSCPEWRNPGT